MKIMKKPVVRLKHLGRKVELKFEEALEALERIVAELEGQELPLEEALRRFEEGVRLSRLCHQMLEQAERRIEILLAEEGRTQLLPWEEDQEQES